MVPESGKIKNRACLRGFCVREEPSARRENEMRENRRGRDFSPFDMSRVGTKGGDGKLLAFGRNWAIIFMNF